MMGAMLGIAEAFATGQTAIVLLFGAGMAFILGLIP